MGLLTVERIGGFAGFGNPGARIRSRGRIELASLSAAERQAVEALFGVRTSARPPAQPDGFSYRISRTGKSGPETVQVPEVALPAAVIRCVRDDLA